SGPRRVGTTGRSGRDFGRCRGGPGCATVVVEAGRIGPRVREECGMTATGSVVVGADGSPAARTAIEYALQDAARRGARLRVVAAAQLPQYWAAGYGMAPIPAPVEIAEEMRSIARQQVEEIR